MLSRIGIRDIVLQTLRKLGYNLVRTEPAGPPGTSEIPDAECYQPFFSPWLRDAAFSEVYSLVAPSTIVSIDRCYTLWTLAHQALNAPGEFVECGVYKGGTARLLAEIVARRGKSRRLHLFDTFHGMPETGEADLHSQGDFVDTSLESVKCVVGHSSLVCYHAGQMPETFKGSEDIRVAFAHVDVDIFQSVLDCSSFIYPRLVPGGIIVFDDYGFPTCPGARKAVDSFFLDKPEQPLILSNAQAVVIRRC
jgi:O-methyltransferase